MTVSPSSLSKMLVDLCPYYMSIGMTYDDYWFGDNYAPRYYLKMDKLRQERKDREMWLQGRYIYEGIGALYPLFNALSKNKKPMPYVEEPYLAHAFESKEETEERKFKESAKVMDALFDEINAEFKKKKGGT